MAFLYLLEIANFIVLYRVDAMLPEELVDLVQQIQTQKCETNRWEVKAAHDGCPKRLYDTLSSFSNQDDGGILVFGIDESSDYQICGVYDAADLQKKLGEQCMQMEPVLRPLCTTAEIDGRTLVSAEIQGVDIDRRPCFYKGSGRLKGSYIRVGDADYPMTEYEIYSYEAYRKKTQDELRPVEHAELSDLDENTFTQYMSKVKLTKQNLAALPVEKIQVLQGITVGEHLSVAGTLLFATYPQAFLPQLCLTAVVVPGVEMGIVGEQGERFIDNARIEGTLPQILEQAIRFVRRNSSVQTIIDPNTGVRIDKTEYPMIAVREILLNAMIHRDYSLHTETSPITLTMYRNRLVAENPGGLYGRITLDTLGHVSADSRNPYIANLMEVLGETENRFSGIPTIRKAMQQHQLPPPLFENLRGVFRATLYNSQSAQNDFKELTLQDEILAFCETPRTRKELEVQFSQYTLPYLMQRFVNPLADKGLLRLSLPQKPKSKNQRYQTILQ
jgi:ATP-dependent DNA helicase RecG